jgi:hypothetical protein
MDAEFRGGDGGFADLNCQRTFARSMSDFGLRRAREQFEREIGANGP